MEMHSKNLTFCRYVNMEEKMIYTPDPEDVNRTLLRQETVVTVQGVPLTSYMESIIVNTVSSNSSKGKAAIEWVVEKLGQECRSLSLSSSLDKLKTEILDLKHTVAESLIQPAEKSIEELQQDLARLELAQIKLDLPSIPSPPLPVGLMRRRPSARLPYDRLTRKVLYNNLTPKPGGQTEYRRRKHSFTTQQSVLCDLNTLNP